MARVLITCTQPRADEIVHDLSTLGIDAVSCPALTISPLKTAQPDGEFDALLITSRHALSADLPETLPVIAIGEETANLAREHGLYVVHTGKSNLQGMDLSAYKNILYPCARQPSLVPDNATKWPVYESIENAGFAIPEGIETICIFSARAAKYIAPMCQKHHHVICLSDIIANILKNQGIDNLAVCSLPRYDILRNQITKRHVHK